MDLQQVALFAQPAGFSVFPKTHHCTIYFMGENHLLHGRKFLSEKLNTFPMSSLAKTYISGHFSGNKFGVLIISWPDLTKQNVA